ncbi:MAG: crotonase/enoyl-CoA hydratase family protein [Methylocystis sp.]|uniref:crotonase/enoyl-CoA hydratase family protein n=2 Tax=Methylocystis sp. TaxID=1911079 RepID=UPI003D09C6F5
MRSNETGEGGFGLKPFAMTSVSPLRHPPQNFPDWRFEYLEIEYDAPTQSVWMNYRADSPHCYTLRMLQDAIEFRDALKYLVKEEGANWPIRYVVMASKKPNVFSLGGDLATFVSCIKRNDRESLLTYAHACIEVMYALTSAFDLPVVTLSVVSGQCMGGGFEGALATDFVIAEEGSRLGVPEIAFNTFPGMGAVTFLTRRVGPARTQQIISAGRVYSARELFDLDIIDLVAPKGGALKTAQEWMHDPDGSKFLRRLALVKHRKQCFPIRKEELLQVVELWTDCSLAISKHDLRYMERLVSAQSRLVGDGPPVDERDAAKNPPSSEAD